MDSARSRSRPGGGNNSNDVIRSALHATARRSSATPPLFRTVTWILIVLCSSFFSFYVGIWTAIQASNCNPTAAGNTSGKPTVVDVEDRKLINNNSPLNCLSDEELHRKVDALAKQKVKAQLEDLCKKLEPAPSRSLGAETLPKPGVSNLFSKTISHFAQGLVRVNKNDLMTTFDFGVPPNAATTADQENYDALILYNTQKSLPTDKKVAQYTDPTKPLPILSASAATENCDTMNVVLMDNPSNTRQCFALIGGQYESYHIQRWMRRPDHIGKLDPTQSLKFTSRGWTAAGKYEFPPPGQGAVTHHQEKLFTYLTEAKNIKARLKSILERMGQKTVIVLTSNHGQSELLMNFACSARARGFDLKNVLIFPTDHETKLLSEGLGLTTFYEETIMASVPKKEAKFYGDSVFTSVMFAKVVCVQLVNELGYDLLFQDVDVVWYKDPLTYFHDTTLPQFDLYFQDDGSRQERYAPYSANTGFYYVRSNDKTRHFFRHLLYSADLIEAWKSHQQVLIALLAEHNSLMGLTVKIFAKQTDEFPGGLHYHRKVNVMKKLMQGQSNACK